MASANGGAALGSADMSGLCILCGRTFKGKIGLGLRRKRAHPVEHNDEIVVERVKKRWSPEETRLLADAELSLIRSGSHLNGINLELSRQFPERTFDAIKSKRKAPAYRALLESMSGILPPALSQPISVLNCSAIDDSVVVCASALPDLAGLAGPEPLSAFTSLALDVVSEPLSTVELCADAPLAEELASISSNLDTLLEEEGQPASPTPQRIVFNRYRVGPVGAEPNVSAARLVIFHYLKCLFEAAPAADSPLDVAWASFLVDFDLDLLHAKVSRGLDEVIPVISVPKSHRRIPQRPRDTDSGAPLSRREARKQDYATFQKLFKKNPKRVLEKILDPPSEGVPFPSASHFSDFWRNVMSLPALCYAGAGSDPDFPDDPFFCSDLSGLWLPIEKDEIERARPKSSSAPGPDGVLMRHLSGLPHFLMPKLLNLFLFLGRLPTRLLESRTIFIPKTTVAAEPGQFRPISMTSTITRIFHMVLAARLSKLLKLSEEQRAFVSNDGLSPKCVLTRPHNSECEGSCVRDTYCINWPYQSL
ncbi:hypothetical protein JTE90_018874 [Oedothorax gibbosus]|uniref:Reverse transcriptase domain-containing protein n=1 Tax=Oedothorax gibbosus TaxID=931172 RepID=A0AAV6TVC3_9ARAC|nr:hypothetical protein JTE90_018874 [Oedothorax gibbosus]